MNRRRAIDLGLIAVLLIVAAVAFTQSYQRWLDPIIDTGRDLYIPEQLTRGAKLYRDIRYQYPPLAPYLLAGITSISGHSLAAYTAIGVAQSFLIALLLYLMGGRRAGFAAALLFAAMSFCGASTWGANFIFPYSYAATFGMALLLLCTWAVLRERFAVAVAAALLASWCKVEYAIAVGILLTVLCLARRFPWRSFAAFVVLWAASAVSAAYYFRDTRWISENIFSRALTKGAIAKRFFAVVSGTADWPMHVSEAVLGALAIAIVIWLLRRGTPWMHVVAFVVGAAATYHDAFFRAWALLQFSALLWALLRDRRSALLPLSLLSIVATLRIPLNVAPVWYGFVLVIPTFLLAAYVLIVYLPERGVYREGASWIWIAVVAFACARSLASAREAYAQKQFPIVSSRGTFYDWNADRAAAINSMLQRVHGGTLVVMPEGITLDYLAEARTPITFHTFTPVETDDPVVEDEILRELAAHPPDRVAIVDRDVREYGRNLFGGDYDIRTRAWLQQHYAPEAQWSGQRFYLYLLRRKL